MKLEAFLARGSKLNTFNMNKILFTLCSFCLLAISETQAQQTFAGNFAFEDTYQSKVWAFNGESGEWAAQSYHSSAATIQIISSNGCFAFVDDYKSKVYAYSGVTGTWAEQPYHPSSKKVVIAQSNGSLVFTDTYHSKVFAFSPRQGTWSQAPYHPSAKPFQIIHSVQE